MSLISPKIKGFCQFSGRKVGASFPRGQFACQWVNLIPWHIPLVTYHNCNLEFMEIDSHIGLNNIFNCRNTNIVTESHFLLSFLFVKKKHFQHPRGGVKTLNPPLNPACLVPVNHSSTFAQWHNHFKVYISAAWENNLMISNALCINYCRIKMLVMKCL